MHCSKPPQWGKSTTSNTKGAGTVGCAGAAEEFKQTTLNDQLWNAVNPARSTRTPIRWQVGSSPGQTCRSPWQWGTGYASFVPSSFWTTLTSGLSGRCNLTALPVFTTKAPLRLVSRDSTPFPPDNLSPAVQVCSHRARTEVTCALGFVFLSATFELSLTGRSWFRQEPFQTMAICSHRYWTTTSNIPKSKQLKLWNKKQMLPQSDK